MGLRLGLGGLRIGWNVYQLANLALNLIGAEIVDGSRRW